MNTHSPAPWLYRGKSDSVHEACETHPFGRQIFRFVEDQAPSDADLALILAAPALFEALDEIGGLSRALRVGGPDPTDLQGLSDALEEAVNLAHDAIAKARGES